MKLVSFGKAPKPDSQNLKPILQVFDQILQVFGPQNRVFVLGIRFWSLPETIQFCIVQLTRKKFSFAGP